MKNAENFDANELIEVTLTFKIFKMNLGKYIHNLLLENETVIIPGFGAFVSNYKPAEINKETNELKPPSKEILFNQQIRNNDGLLVGSIALGEAVSHFDALKIIEKERENIIYQLDKNEKVTLDKTGELFVNERNEIQFKAFEDENLLLDSFGLETVSLKESVEKEADIVEEEIETEKIIVSGKKEEIQEAKPIPEQVTEEKPEKEEKKKRSWMLLLLILVPIIIVGVYILIQNKNIEKPPVKTKDESTLSIKEEPIVKTDSIVIDSIPVISQDSSDTEKLETTPVENIVSDSPKFYLVGGSFKVEENANDYILQLKEKGFEPFLLGKRGNFYIIAIGTYDTEKEALAAKQKFIKNSQGSGVWVMEDKK